MTTEDPRERVLHTAYDLFSRHGIQATGIDRIIAEAGVAKMTLYRKFPSKDDLVLAALERREEVWTWGWLEREVERRADMPSERLLAIFDAFNDWFGRDDYESCFFTNSLLETHDRTGRIGAESVSRLANIRSVVRGLAVDAGIRDPDRFARQWQLLMWGSIIAAATGDVDAADQARDVATLLLQREVDPAQAG